MACHTGYWAGYYVCPAVVSMVIETPPLTIVVLMLHGFLGLRLNEQLSSEANLVLVVDSHLEERSHVV